MSSTKAEAEAEAIAAPAADIPTHAAMSVCLLWLCQPQSQVAMYHLGIAYS